MSLHKSNLSAIRCRSSEGDRSIEFLGEVTLQCTHTLMCEQIGSSWNGEEISRRADKWWR